jgi:hypothetical protein
MTPGRLDELVRGWIHALAGWNRRRGAVPGSHGFPATVPERSARPRAVRQAMSRTDEIRLRMLAELGNAGRHSFPRITQKISVATDAHELWYLRGEFMAALSSIHGEAAAQERVAAITLGFKGLLPEGLLTRQGQPQSGSESR